MRLTPFLLGYLLASACATKPHLVAEYQESLQKSDKKGSNRTVFVFLIDGLPFLTLQNELKIGNLPHLQRYFRTPNGRVFKARTAFPSLTFPSIASLLTRRPVDQTGIYGNKIFNNGERVNFETPQSYPTLNRILGDSMIFKDLKDRGLRSVSVEYSFHEGADAFMGPVDLATALAIEKKDYEYIDRQLIRSLRLLLEDTPIKAWPDFVYVHLIGVDLTSHDRGPKSKEVSQYLKFLDKQLAPVFRLLERIDSNKTRQTLSLLTSDHGFDQNMTKFFDLEAMFAKLDPQIRILNEGRFAGIYFPPRWTPVEKQTLMEELAAHPTIDITAFAKDGDVFSLSKNKRVQLAQGSGSCEAKIERSPDTEKTFLCIEKTDSRANSLFYPFFLNNISQYFRSPEHPDAVIIAASGKSFAKTGLGQHGGPSPQEIFVPLLIRHHTYEDPKTILPLSEILSFL